MKSERLCPKIVRAISQSAFQRFGTAITKRGAGGPVVAAPQRPAAAVATIAARQASSAKAPITISFLIDATASRSATWREAAEIQKRMLMDLEREANDHPLEIGVFYHQGIVEHLGWYSNPRVLADAMDNISCRSALTLLKDGLEQAVMRDRERPVQAIYMIGDCNEEPLYRVEEAAYSVSRLGVPVYAFYDDCTKDKDGEIA